MMTMPITAWELPPRTRRILVKLWWCDYVHGTTSAYAENTQASPQRAHRLQNYLRVRGEYFSMMTMPITAWELPPRTRRILFNDDHAYHRLGTTSAYAENTQASPQRAHRLQNYLRVRGEYSSQITGTITLMELPPRTRRIQCLILGVVDGAGTTSAYAENTVVAVTIVFFLPNYLRVRGEYSICTVARATLSELPPRTRRILLGVLPL